MFVLGKHSGRHAVKARLEALGYPQTEEQIDQLFQRFKKLADQKKKITDEDLLSLVI